MCASGDAVIVGFLDVGDGKSPTIGRAYTARSLFIIGCGGFLDLRATIARDDI